jgi:hypothetical protein
MEMCANSAAFGAAKDVWFLQGCLRLFYRVFAIKAPLQPFFIARGTLRKHLFSLFTQELQLNVALESFKSSQPAPK